MKSFLKYHIKDRLILAKQAYQLKYYKEIPVLVFTMAKVGSLSVYQSLRQWGYAPVFHMHSLNEEEVKSGVAQCFANGIYPGSRSPVFLLNNYLKTNPKIKIVSLFRNPVERNISAFFDAFEFYLGMPVTAYTGSVSSLEKVFHEKMNHQYAIHWYDHQFLEGLKLNVYATSFDTNKKYQIFKKDHIEILLLDSRLADEKKETLIADFCGMETFTLKNVNVTSQTKHARLYKEFKSTIRFDSSYLNEQLMSKYTQHFFTKADIKDLYDTWLIS